MVVCVRFCASERMGLWWRSIGVCVTWRERPDMLVLVSVVSHLTPRRMWLFRGGVNGRLIKCETMLNFVVFRIALLLVMHEEA